MKKLDELEKPTRKQIAEIIEEVDPDDREQIVRNWMEEHYPDVQALNGQPLVEAIISDLDSYN